MNDDIQKEIKSKLGAISRKYDIKWTEHIRDTLLAFAKANGPLTEVHIEMLFNNLIAMMKMEDLNSLYEE